MQYVGVLLELQGLECLDQQQVPLNVIGTSEHICSAACSLSHSWQMSEAQGMCWQARGQLATRNVHVHTKMVPLPYDSLQCGMSYVPVYLSIYLSYCMHLIRGAVNCRLGGGGGGPGKGPVGSCGAYARVGARPEGWTTYRRRCRTTGTVPRADVYYGVHE